MATECLSNIKQLGLSTLMYMNDHNDKFIPKGEDVHKALAPYTKLKAAWNCPDTGKPAYTLNANLLGRAATAIARPAETVMLYEGKGGKLDYRHEGRASVCFADGHAKLIDKLAGTKLRWKP